MTDRFVTVGDSLKLPPSVTLHPSQVEGAGGRLPASVIPLYDDLPGKPAVIAEGADAKEARSKIGVATSYSNNLLDPHGYTPLSTLNHVTGELGPNATHHVTTFIPVKPNTFYTSSQLARVVEYTADKELVKINNGSEAAGSTMTIRTSATTAYVRAVVSTGYFDGPYATLMAFQEGSVKVTPVEKWQERPDLTTYNPGKVQLAERTGRGVLGLRASNDYVASPAIPSRETQTNPAPADIFAVWDALVTAYPSQVTRAEVATTKGGRKVYQYDIKPPRPVTATNAALKPSYPKALVVAGVHGTEVAAMWNLADTFTRIFASWNTSPALEAMRWEIDWSIIPLVNPDGLAAFTRRNGDGVDIARNFSTGWNPGTPTDQTYGGAAPLNQPESQAIARLIHANRGATLFLDHHNFSTHSAPYGWIPAASPWATSIGQAHSQAQTRLWQKNRPTLDQTPGVFFINTEAGAPGGTPAMQAVADGINLSCVLECSQSVSPEAAQGTINQTMAHESLVNFLVLALGEGTR